MKDFSWLSFLLGLSAGAAIASYTIKKSAAATSAPASLTLSVPPVVAPQSQAA